MFTLAAGAFDYGQAWRSGLAVNEAARTGARTGSGVGPERLADYYALSGAKSALESSGKLDGVQRVVIFRSDNADGRVPQSCKTGSGSGRCTIITGDQFRQSWGTGNFRSDGCFNNASVKGWCPTTRNNVQASTEYFGIWIQYRHDFTFTILGSGNDVDRQAVMRLEPKEK